MSLFTLPTTQDLVIHTDLFTAVPAPVPTPFAGNLGQVQPETLLTPAHLPLTSCYPYLAKPFCIASQDGYAAVAEHLPFIRRTWALRDAAQLAEAAQHTPTLRYIKDGAIVDIEIENMSTQTFLSRYCLKLNTKRGLFVLSKRLSRIMRPFRYFGFFDTSTVNIVCDPSHDQDSAWDGMSLVSPQFVKRLVYSGQWQGQYPDNQVLQQKQRALLKATRLELTLMTADGQIKGHALVVDGLPAGIDVVTNWQNIKTELSQHDGQTFVGLDIVHGKAAAEIDKQSLINLYPFLDPKWLIDNLHQETDTLLEELATQQPEVAETTGTGKTSPLQHFLNKGGDPRHFMGLRRMQYRSRLDRLTYYTYPDLRLPGFQRAYICTDSNVGLEIPRGCYLLNPDWDSVIVNAQDWREFIANVLGGADMDDGVLIHQFIDIKDNTEKAVIWRQPNQWGEVVILRPLEVTAEVATAEADVATSKNTAPLPHNDSRLLPPRIDRQPRPTEALQPETQTADLPARYSIQAMNTAAQAAAANDGVLGQFCNLLMLAVAVYGVAPVTAPVRLETIIDATVKTGADISWVKEWITQAAVKMVQHRPIPRYLHAKLWGLLRDVKKRPFIKTASGHWLDTLHTHVGLHIVDYRAAMDAQLAQVTPPVALLRLAVTTTDTDVDNIGGRLHALYEAAYQAVYGRSCDELAAAKLTKQRRDQLTHQYASQAAQQALHAELCKAPESMQEKLLFILAYAYLQGQSDRAIWNRTLTATAVTALAERGWLAVADDQQVLTVTVQHVWYNLKYARVPVARRPKMSAAERDETLLAQVAHVGSKISVVEIRNGRAVHSQRTGLLMGMLAKTACIPNGKYTVQLAYPSGDGGLRMWLVNVEK